MSNLTNNTTALHDILDAVNALQEAGSGEISLQEKTVTPTKSAQEIVADSGYDGLSKVNVDKIPDAYIVPSGSKTITENGNHDVKQYETVEVTVPIPDDYIKPSGTLNISENGEYDVTEKAGVVVAVPTPDPVLQSKTVSPNTIVQTVTPDSGYDGLSSVKVNAMPTTTQATPTISVDSSGKITASATQSEGYVSAGTKSATEQLTTQAAQTITPGTTDQTIDSGKYLTGVQTIKGDPNLISENIKNGVSIFGVAGTLKAETVFLTMTGTWNQSPCNVSIDGVKYYAPQTIEVPKGTELVFTVFSSKDADSITVDGVGVATATTAGSVAQKFFNYTHIITDDITANGYSISMATYGIEILTQSGSGGEGGGVETCTVTTNNNTLTAFHYTSCINGELVYNTLGASSQDVVLENVACGSLIFTTSGSGNDPTVNGDAQMICSYRSGSRYSAFVVNGDCQITGA